MMDSKQIDDGGSAFPAVIGPPSELSRRDWFAGQVIGAVVIKCAEDLRFLEGMTPAEYFASKAFEIADAMIEARKGGAA